MTHENPLTGLTDLVNAQKADPIKAKNSEWARSQQQSRERANFAEEKQAEFKTLLEAPEIIGSLTEGAALIDRIRPGTILYPIPPEDTKPGSLRLSVPFISTLDTYSSPDDEWNIGSHYWLTRTFNIVLDKDHLQIDRWGRKIEWFYRRGGLTPQSRILDTGEWKPIKGYNSIPIADFPGALTELLTELATLKDTKGISGSEGDEKQIGAIGKYSDQLLYPLSVRLKDENKREQAVNQSRQRVLDLKEKAKALDGIPSDRKRKYTRLLSNEVIDGLITSAARIAEYYPIAITVTDPEALSDKPAIELNWFCLVPESSGNIRSGRTIQAQGKRIDGIRIESSRNGVNILTTNDIIHGNLWEGGGYYSIPNTKSTVTPSQRDVPIQKLSEVGGIILNAVESVDLKETPGKVDEKVLKNNRRIILL